MDPLPFDQAIRPQHSQPVNACEWDDLFVSEHLTGDLFLPRDTSPVMMQPLDLPMEVFDDTSTSGPEFDDSQYHAQLDLQLAGRFTELREVGIFFGSFYFLFLIDLDPFAFAAEVCSEAQQAAYAVRAQSPVAPIELEALPPRKPRYAPLTALLNLDENAATPNLQRLGTFMEAKGICDASSAESGGKRFNPSRKKLKRVRLLGRR